MRTIIHSHDCSANATVKIANYKMGHVLVCNTDTDFSAHTIIYYITKTIKTVIAADENALGVV